MSSEEPEKLVEGTLISHLLELRDRLIRAIIAVALAFLPCVFYSNQIFTFIATPLKEKLPKGTQLIATTVMSPFTTPFKLSLFVAVFLAMPFIIYQLWAFVAPGLYRHEKRFAVPLLISSIVLFYVGVVFAYFFVFPVMFQFFASTTPHGVAMMTDISSYLDFVLKMFLAFGAAFEVPIAVVLLVLTGVVKLEKLKEHRGYVLIGIFIVAALLTPPDAVSQCIMAIPMSVEDAP
jgi:sec-independent protein translocase protein TatC